MKTTVWISAIALLAAVPAFAEDEGTETESDASRQVKDALKSGADAPKTPPTLPDQASDRARYVLQNIAFGKNGEAHRAAADASKSAKDEAQAKASQHAKDARAGAAARAAQGGGAASAARFTRGRR